MIVNLINQHADRFMQVGLHLLWQGTALAILAALVSRFICKNPQQRATLYLGSLFALSLCVPVTLMTLASPSPAAISPSLTSFPVPEMVPSTIPLASESPTQIAASQSPLPLSTWIAGIYLAGLLLMMARVIRGYLWSSKIRRNGQPVQEGHWPDALTQAITTMKLRTKPAMIWSKKVTSPVVTGILRPMIVLPVSLMSGLPKEQAIAVLSHELAHLRRCDHLIVVGQRLLEALFFFHPAVWFLSRRLDQEREKACDDLVIKAGHYRADYAEALVKIAGNHQPTLALAAAKNTHLKERIFRILNHPQPTTVQVNRGGWLTIAAAIGALGFLSLSPALSEEKEIEEPEKTGAQAIVEKLKIQIPVINFHDTTLQEAVEFLRKRSIELDPSPNPKQKGVNFAVRIAGDDKSILNTKIDNLVVQNSSFQGALGAICSKTKTRFKINEFAVVILPLPVPGEVDEGSFVQRRWNNLPDFPALIAATGISQRSKSIVGHLEALGVIFPKGAAASYIFSWNSLIVRNTPDNLELIDTIVKAYSDPKSAKVQRVRAKAREAKGRAARVEMEAYDKLLVQRKWITFPDFLDRLIPRKAGSTRISTEDYLQEYGVTFLGNSAASFVRESNTLVVRNTPKNLELIDALVEAASDPDLGKEREKAAATAKKNIQELQKIIIPKVIFKDATLKEAIDFLRARSLEFDPAKKGVKLNIIGDDNKLAQTKVINLNFRKVPLTEILKIVCDITETRYKLEGRNISILPLKE